MATLRCLPRPEAAAGEGGRGAAREGTLPPPTILPWDPSAPSLAGGADRREKG